MANLGKKMAERIMEKAIRESGMHTSRSDSNNHLTIKNAENLVIGHLYKDGSVKGTNQGGSGALPWLMK